MAPPSNAMPPSASGSSTSPNTATNTNTNTNTSTNTNSNTNTNNPSTTSTSANSTPQQQQQSNQQQQNKKNQDKFLTDDYYPIQEANKAILSALRFDETSSNADLYKKIAASNMSSSTYNLVTGDADGYNSSANANTNGHNGHNQGDANGRAQSHSQQQSQQQQRLPQNSNIHPTLKYTNSIPLPPYITSIIQTETKMSSLMGILPQANMVWVSVDDALYLWEYGSSLSLDNYSYSTGMNSGNYGHGHGGSYGNGTGVGMGGLGGHSRDDFVCFKVPSGQCIVSVGLVKPKRGVFKDVVEWCLVVTTHEEAIICALARESMIQQQTQPPSPPPSSSSMSDTFLKLIPTRYLIPTDSIPMLSICGTDDGRIFMGGYDGCLYEMSYEGFVPSSSQNGTTNRLGAGGRWYEDDDNNVNYSMVNTLASGGKRALSTLVFGPSAPDGGARPRKCRKVNHTSVAPPIVSAFVPGFVLNAASYVFGGSNATASAAGPIVKLTLDGDRRTMYALTSRGFIHAFDLDSTGSGIESNGFSNGNNKNGNGTSTIKLADAPKLACTINVSKSVRRYLDCVAHGKMYAPLMTGTDGSIAAVHFPGGGAAAQAGVGGMEGARSILKIADSEMMRKKQKYQTASNRSGSGNTNGRMRNTTSGRRMAVADGCLHPISIHVIPPSESNFLTLAVISASGLRYYLSVLPDAGTGRYGNNSVKPGRRFSLCHIRAPPPLATSSDGDLVFDRGNMNASSSSMTIDGRDGTISPWLQGRNGNLNFEAKNSCYTSGVTLLAIENKNADRNGNGDNRTSKQKAIGDSMLVMMPDYTSQDERGSPFTAGTLSTYMDTSPPIGGSGLSEVVSQPMRRQGSTRVGASTMTGGHIWDIAVGKSDTADRVSSLILNLYFKSLTPSDSILESDIVPPFIPLSMLTRRSKVTGGRIGKLPVNTPFDAAKSASERQSMKSEVGFFTGGIGSLALNVFGSMFFGRPAIGVRGREQTMPNYVVAQQYGCGAQGFSSSAVERSNYGRKSSSKSSRRSQSQRLQPSLLHPSMAPLPEMSLQHLVTKTRRQGLIALNSGGLHYFSQLSPVDILQSILMESNSSNIGRDENVKSFVSNYGHAEFCALCLSIAIDDKANDKLARSAVQAALAFTDRPSMVPSPSGNGGNSIITDVPSWSNLSGYENYSFKPSSLHDGLVALVSRLLRPVWCKPAVVVTEGKIIQPKRRGQRPRAIPAKVELLLDESTLDRIRRPLTRLQILVREMFQPAVNAVPGAKPHLGDNTMDMDDSEGRFPGRSNLMTSAVQFQTQAFSQNQNLQSTQYTERELNVTAQLNEERSIHATYRILSRSVQLLTLMSHLHRAHGNPKLPEVDFGYLHGLTYSQLVTSKAAQDRIDTVLTNLFTENSTFDSFGNASGVSSSVESSNLSSLLSQQCYLYFSIGSRLTHLGFSNAYAALSQQLGTKIKHDLTQSASSYLRQAASHWFNPLLISGQMDGISRGNGSTSYDEIAIRAHESGSPLARAALVLMQLNDVVGVVDLCLICASNFGGVIVENGNELYNTERVSGTMMSWEKGLYHRPSASRASDETGSQHFSPSTSTAIILGHSDVDTQKIDARCTCHAILFYFLNRLLKSTQEDDELVQRMIFAATASTDKSFLKELYGYLVSSGHVDTLLRINTPSVESWLENVNKDPDLVWRYFVLHGMYTLAGEFMWKRGSTSEENLRLEERIECLTRAYNSYQTFNPLEHSIVDRNAMVPSRDEIKRIINQITEQIDVAKLQSRVLSAIMSSRNASQLDKEKLQILSSSLVHVSVLYNDYAAPLALYDLCLAIMQTCRYDDAATIITLWKSILCEELLPCRTESREVQNFLNSLQKGSMLEEERVILSDSNVTLEDGNSLMLFETGEWIPSIKHRIISLGKELHGKGADFVFPIEFIVEQLEGLYCVHKAVSNKPAAPWTLQTLIEAGTSFPSLLEAYNSIVVAQEPDAPNPITKITQLSCISKVLKQWLSSATAYGDKKGDSISMQLKRYTPILLQQIDAFKSSLESIVGWNSQDVSNLYEVFSEIEEALQRNDN